MKTVSNYLYLSIAIFSITFTSAIHASENLTIEEQMLVIEEKAKEAKHKNALWRDTMKHLSIAKEHIANNRLSEATLLLKNVEFQLEQAQLQAQEQTDINQLVPTYLRN